MRGRRKRGFMSAVIWVLLMICLTGTVSSAYADEPNVGFYLRDSYNTLLSLFDTMNIREGTFRRTADFSKDGYSALLDAISFRKEDGVSGTVEIAFPILTLPGESDLSYIPTDCAVDVSLSLVFANGYSEDTLRIIAVPNHSYIEKYAADMYPGAVIKTYAGSEECLYALSDGAVESALILTCELNDVLYSDKRFDGYGTVEPEVPCRLCIAVQDEELAAKIHSAMEDPSIRLRTEGKMRTFLQGAAARAGRKNFIASNIALLVFIPVMIAMIIVIWVLYKSYKKAHREQEAVINGLSSDFVCITLLDARSKHENRIRINPEFENKIDQWAETGDFDLRMRKLAEKLVFEEDRTRFLRENDRQHVLDELKESSSFTVNYRLMTDQGIRYFQSKYVRDEENRNNIIMGIHDVDREVRREQELQKKIQENAMVQRLSLQIVTTLVKMIEAKDKYTNGHSLRVAEYAREIAARSGMNEKKQQEIYYMGLLHDIGKIGVPDDVINKTGRLTEEEFALVRRHPVLGSEILESITEMPRLKDGARHHHEHYDGKGYPDKLAGEEISRESRILGVADAYDAMSSPRSFRDAMEQAVIRSEIEKGRGNQFDPEYADIMLHMIDEDKDFNMRDIPD